jgi:hydrogenase nickel incorporation protein HypA/HybF
MSQDVRESIHFLPESIYAYYRCPRCGSIDFEIVKGRGISEIRVEDHD